MSMRRVGRQCQSARRPPDVRKPYRWDRGRKLTAAKVRAAVERAIALSDKR